MRSSKVSIVWANVTSLAARRASLGCESDVLLFQEISLFPRGKQEMTRTLSTFNRAVLWGQGPLDGTSTGVCCALPSRLPALEVTSLGDMHAYAVDGRFQHVILSLEGVKVHLLNVYCKVSDPSYNEKFMWALQLYTAGLGHVPILLGGDFQSDVIASSVFQQWFHHGWQDLADLCELGGAPTWCHGGKWHAEDATRTLNDLVLANALAACMVESFEHRVDFNRNLMPLQIGERRPDHVPLQVTLNTSALHDAKVVVTPLEPAGPPPETWPIMPLEDEHELAKEVWDAFSDAFTEAVGSRAVDSAYGIWCEAATSFLSRRVGVRFPPRGTLAKPQVVPAMGSGSYCGPSEPHRLREGRRAARCLRECLCILNRYGDADLPIHDRIRFESTWERGRCLGRKLLHHSWPECPSFSQVQEALAALEIEIDDQLRLVVDSRRQHWKHMLHDSDISSSKGLFGLLKAPPAPRMHSMVVDGTLTFDINKILGKVADDWAKIFDRSHAPSPAAFLEEYAEEISAMALPCELPAISGADLMKQVHDRPKHAVGGLDSWRTYELQHLPVVFWDPMARLLDVAETHGLWPSSMLSVNVTLLSKGEGTEPLKLRPISCAAVIRAVWASLRYRHIKLWLHRVCPSEVLGEPLEQVLEMALLHEEAVNGVSASLSTMFFDKTKCFDKIVLPIWAGLWAAIGGPRRLICALEGFYGNLTRRFKINGVLGEPWQSTAPLQGCALSVAMIHVLMGVWCRRNTKLGLLPRAYVDDSRVSFESSNVQAATAAWQEVQLFDALSGQETNTGKSFAVVPRPSLGKTITAATEGALEIRAQAKVVGHQIVGGKLRRVIVGDERAQVCTDTLHRMRSVGVSPHVAGKYAATKAMKQFLYGCEVSRPAVKAMERVRYAMTSTLWTQTRQQRNPEILLTLLRKGHLLDPFQAVTFQTVMGLRRLFRKRPDLYARAAALWPHCHQADRSRMVGPVRNLAYLLGDMQLEWVDLDTVQSRQGRALHLWHGSGSFLAHRLREELRWSRWQRIARKDMAGVHGEVGINVFATTCLWRGGLNRRDIDCLVPNCRRQLARICGGSLSRYMLGALEGVITGATTSRYELVKQRLVDNATCIHCHNNVDETRQHLFWECPAWDYIRRATVEKFCPGVWERHLHPVTRSSGITMNPEWFHEEWDRLAQMPQQQPDAVAWEVAQHQVQEGPEGILVWTDGSTIHSCIPDLVRSGLGIFFREGSSLNFSAALAGELQSNNRAELLAVLLAAEQGVSWERPMVVHSDSWWVVERALTLHARDSVPCLWEHRDLWVRLWRACRTVRVHFIFVPSHLSQADCHEHGVTPLQVAGNNAADVLAKKGVDLHCHAQWNARVQQFGQLLRDTMWIQVCMVCICLARTHQAKQQPQSVQDHPQVVRGWEQLQQRLLQALDGHPTGGRRCSHKAPPVGDAHDPPAAVEAPASAHDTEHGRVSHRPLKVYSRALGLNPRMGDAVSMEWRDVPKPWLLVKRASGFASRDAGMTFQLGVKPCLLPAMEWYLGQLQWPEEGRSHDISWLELAIDFEVATGVMLEMPRQEHPKQLGQRGRAFSSAASAVGRCVNRRPWPIGVGSQTVSYLHRKWGLPRTSGLVWRPTLLNVEIVEHFFRVAGEETYATDADFFRQQPPLLVRSRESEWDAMVRRVPIFVRREERRGHESEIQHQWCVQAVDDTGDSPAPAPVSAKLSKKITDWSKRRERVDLHNATAAERKMHFILLPQPPDPTLSGPQYAQEVKALKVQCEWCKRDRPLADFGDFMKRGCPSFDSDP